MNSISVKAINKMKVYFSIYINKSISKMQIVQELGIGLSTVSQNLKELEDESLIIREGYLDSTGGRRANSIVINKKAKISIGIGLFKEKIHIIAIDLYGDLICSKEIKSIFENSEEYFLKLNEYLESFIKENNLENILGVAIAIQGLLSEDNKYISYGKIMDNYNMSLEDIKRFIKYPCRIEHDSKAAGFYELWNDTSIYNAVVILLNENLGGAIIANRKVQEGQNRRSGIIEHICIDKNGPTCYCGKKGCFETYCSLNSLKEKIDINIEDFFIEVRSGNNENYEKIWQEYLYKLSFIISNLNIIFDNKIILSGYLSSYLKEEDIDFIYNECREISAFSIDKTNIKVGNKGKFSPTVGAALYYIEEFLSSFNN